MLSVYEAGIGVEAKVIESFARARKTHGKKNNSLGRDPNVSKHPNIADAGARTST